MKKLLYFLVALASILTTPIVSTGQSIGCDSCTTQAKGNTKIQKALAFRTLTVTQAFKNYYAGDTAAMIFRDAVSDSIKFMYHGVIYNPASGGGGGSVALPANRIGVGTGTGIGSFNTLIYEPSTGFNASDGTGLGIFMDFTSGGLFLFGDLSVSKTYLQILPNLATIKGNYDGVSTYGNMLSLNGVSHIYTIGDVDQIATGALFKIIERTSTTWETYVGDNAGKYLQIDQDRKIYRIGDIDSVNSGTSVTANDNLKVVISTNGIAEPTYQIYTGGGNVIINDGVAGIIYDPASIVTSATITFPANPVDGQYITMLFGGTITNAGVITTLTVAPNSGQTIIGNPIIGAVTSSRPVTARYRASITAWYTQ